MVCMCQPSDREKWDGSWRASKSVAESWGRWGRWSRIFVLEGIGAYLRVVCERGC